MVITAVGLPGRCGIHIFRITAPVARILIVGGDSKIGALVARQLTLAGHEVFKTTRKAEQVTDHNLYLDLSKSIEHWHPPRVDSCLLAAAVTSIKHCQDEPEYCERVNVGGILKLARILRTLKTYILFLSTSQVFDGRVPHVPPCTPLNPMTLYGAHKAKVETELSLWKTSAGILRISKVLGKDDFLLQSWKNSLKRGAHIQAFYDYSMAPVAMDYVANVIGGLLLKPVRGVMQLSGDKDVSYFDAANLLAEACGIKDSIHAVSAKKNNALPHIPAYTSLDCSRIESVTGQKTPASIDTLKQLIAAMLDE